MQHLMTVLISEHTGLYQREEPENETKIPSQQPQNPLQRCRVEWLSQEGTDLPPSSNTDSKTPKEKPQPSTPSTDSKQTAPSPVTTSEKREDGQNEEKSKRKTEEKVDGKADSKAEGKGGSEVAVSPGKQSRALPSWRCSFQNVNIDICMTGSLLK